MYKLLNTKDIIKNSIQSNKVIYNFFKYIYTFTFHRERFLRTKHLGEENKDKTVFIVRPNSEDGIQGLLSLVSQALRWIDYSEKNNYKTIVDYKNFNTQYSNGVDNAWEYYFKQPSDITLESAYKSNKVIFSGISPKIKLNENTLTGEIFNDEKLKEESTNLVNKYLILNEKVSELIEKENQILNVQNCIGVFIRGTDYVALKPAGEYVQPTIEEVIEKVDEFLNKYNDNKIFLVTEDNNYYQILKKRYGDKLLTVLNDNLIENYSGGTYLSKSGSLQGSAYERGMTYLVKIVLLSRCRYLVSSIATGSIIAYSMNNNKYKDYFIFNKGKY